VAGVVATVYGWIVVHKALAVSRRAVRSGAEGLVGRVGEVRATPSPLGQVFLDGALWRARLWVGDEDATLERGDPIVVERVDGLTLTVRRAEEWEVAP
jgi:membrane protein implicated in regulation of membrane protease activity